MDDAIAIESLPENETQIEVIRDLDAGREKTRLVVDACRDRRSDAVRRSVDLRAAASLCSKPQHGHYVVEKRRRDLDASETALETGARSVIWCWEYQVQGRK